jgi:hypothetical protein
LFRFDTQNTLIIEVSFRFALISLPLLFLTQEHYKKETDKLFKEFDILKSNQKFFATLGYPQQYKLYRKITLLQNGGRFGGHAASIGPTTLHRQAGQAVLQHRAQGGPARLSQLFNTCRALCGQSQAKLPEVEVEEGEASELRAARVEDVGNGEKLATEVNLSLQVCRRRGCIVRAPVELAQIPLSDQDLVGQSGLRLQCLTLFYLSRVNSDPGWFILL